MNIFVLDADQFVAAQMMCDKHLVKMIREEVASLLREKSMKRKNIKEGALDDQIAAAEKKVDDAKPTGVLQKILGLYRDVIGFIQFFGKRKFVEGLRDNLKALQKSFTDSFEVAKLIRQVIIKIVKQLSNLPKTSPSDAAKNASIVFIKCCSLTERDSQSSISLLKSISSAVQFDI